MYKKFTDIKVGEYFTENLSVNFVWQKIRKTEVTNCNAICIKGYPDREYPSASLINEDISFYICDKDGNLFGKCFSDIEVGTIFRDNYMEYLKINETLSTPVFNCLIISEDKTTVTPQPSYISRHCAYRFEVNEK